MVFQLALVRDEISRVALDMRVPFFMEGGCTTRNVQLTARINKLAVPCLINQCA